MINISDDSIFDANKQEPLNNFKEEIESLFDAEQISGTIINGVIENVSAKEIGQYLNLLIIGKSIKLKAPLLTEAPIDEKDLFQNICDYIGIEKLPSSENAKIYFLESGNFAITIIPIDLNKQKTNLFIQPLEDSPLFIVNLWGKTKDTERKDIDLDNIPGVRRGF